MSEHNTENLKIDNDLKDQLKTVIHTVENIWEYDSITCFTAKNPFDGINGYVIIPQDSKLYNTIQYDLPHFNVHGGITFDRKLDGVGRIIGWDTCHLGDNMNPEFILVDLRDNIAFQHLFVGRIWDEKIVIEETNILASQLYNYLLEEKENIL